MKNCHKNEKTKGNTVLLFQNRGIIMLNSYQQSLWLSKECPKVKAKPFLKWAGGKTQLLAQMVCHFPSELEQGKIQRYIEPFVGSGAVLFLILQHYKIREFFISDVNEELISAYIAVKKCVEELIAELSRLEQKYHELCFEDQKKFFYKIRSEFNHNRPKTDFSQPDAERTAQLIFLNRTCFNGLFRVNAKGVFNVPCGSYKNPKICFSENLRAISDLLQNVEIRNGDFTICETFADSNTFVYFDPPYRPISPTASFNSYQQSNFDDRSQIRLADFFRKLDRTGAKLMLSNSDPHNFNSEDNFFQTVFEGFQINRIFARRMINCNGKGRSKISELLITNYGEPDN